LRLGHEPLFGLQTGGILPRVASPRNRPMTGRER
jgi:hypothetical protein